MPSVVIIIPSYNRAEKVRKCLRALALLEGGPYETIVVDDGSTTPIASICEEIGPWVRTIRRSNCGAGAARNVGAAASDAEVLCFTDDDCLPRPDWILQLLAVHSGTPMRLVGGHVENALDRNVFSAASQSICTYLYEYYQGTSRKMAFFTSNNICCFRKDFLALAGFDERFATASEDRDFCLRWQDIGGHLVHARDATIDHAHDLTFMSFWQQHAKYGRGARQLHLALNDRGDNRPKIEPVGFYTGLLLHPLRRPGYLRLLRSFLMALSQVAMVSGYFGAIREEWRANPTSRSAQ